jgi:NAD(P)-dependent dehydrogenase (short-subunit alcohol dehydrogenase family)
MTDRPTFLLLTGASSGIGRDMAIRLSAGQRLILNGRDAARLESTRAACHDPSSHLVWRFDLSDPAGVDDDLARLLDEKTAAVSGFVHCAALLQILPLRSLALSQVKQAFDVNFFSAMEIARALTRRKVNQRNLTSIVFISSIASQFGARGFSAYCATKGALDALMKALAVELAPEVRVNSVLPGGIRTEMSARIFESDEMVAKFERDYPLGIGSPDDVTSMVEFLLSPRARWITGQQMVVDGGRTANITA